MYCVKIIKSISLVALDNFYKLNCILLIFFALLFLLCGSLLPYSYFRGLCAFCMVSPQKKMPLELCNEIFTSIINN